MKHISQMECSSSELFQFGFGFFFLPLFTLTLLLALLLASTAKRTVMSTFGLKFCVLRHPAV